ncbi:hypothetical protein [Halocatena pleomorpha]|uniref:Uncharacterized protein n=1 Tax=Halocatena pleomorpha TaxID=1785090 RepID=A0A3P3R7V5_9EURY|nr:hypothetical protein [Halocatena pleomorpha]RRJ29552.1 hypothetical protein EIK79_13020 [Halocatena pleomorpha]
MTLASRKSNDFDAALPKLLYEGWVTPAQTQIPIAEYLTAEVPWQYIVQRLSRLSDPDHDRSDRL